MVNIVLQKINVYYFLTCNMLIIFSSNYFSFAMGAKSYINLILLESSRTTERCVRIRCKTVKI